MAPRTSKQVLEGQKADAAREQSPRSGTQTLVSAPVPSDDSGNLVAKISPEAALTNVQANVAAWQGSTLLLVCSGAILFVVGAVTAGKAKAKTSFENVMTTLAKAITEKNVKQAMAYRILQVSQELGRWIAKPEQAGILAKLCEFSDAAEATAFLLAQLKADHGVTSFNSLRVAIGREKAYTPEVAKAEAEAKAKAETPAGKAKAKRAKVQRAVDVIADANPGHAFAMVAKAKGGTLLDMVIAEIVSRIVTPADCDTLIASVERHKQHLLSQEAGKGYTPPASTPRPEARPN